MSKRDISTFVRFIKFGIVGGSGVFVNLGIYALLTRIFGLGDELTGRFVSYALSVEISIITNFILNDIWTFSDRGRANRLSVRFVRFHVVSFLGALINWGVFAVLNWLLENGDIVFVGDVALFGRSWNVDDLVAGCLGIIAAMMWNFFANLLWTWKEAS